MNVLAVVTLVLTALAGCRSATVPGDSLSTREVRLPNGVKILTEIKATQEDRAQGMMFRDSLAADRGMLFVHERPGKYSYWMFNCRIPLDIVIRTASDAGQPPAAGEGAQADAFAAIAARVKDWLDG